METVSSNLSELIAVTSGIEVAFKIGKDLEQRLTGRFYTHERIGRAMARDIAERSAPTEGSVLRIVDPFCGDGRLVCWLIEELFAAGKVPREGIAISLWDCDENAIGVADRSVRALLSHLAITQSQLDVRIVDSFAQALKAEGAFDICVTNPPWETIKPDSRELAALSTSAKEAYITLLKEKVIRLEKAFPHSKPTRKFSGWGANLARCGIEASVCLVGRQGLFGIVAPASIFGDQVSAPLRKWLLTTNTISSIHHYSAEARLFGGVDQAAVYFVGDKGDPTNPVNCFNNELIIVKHPDRLDGEAPATLHLKMGFLESHDYAIGFSSSKGMSLAMPYLQRLPKLGDFESGQDGLIRVGRELDETGIARRLCKNGIYRFVKGRQVARYSFDGSASDFLNPEIPAPTSANCYRVVWRDVARQSSARRMIATLLPPGYVTGNSLNILTVKSGHERLLKAMLAILNSVVFEAQVRATISTNHLSVGAIRKIRIPDLNDDAFVNDIGFLVDKHLAFPSSESAASIDITVARWYGLPDYIYTSLLDQLEMNAPDDVVAIRALIATNASEKMSAKALKIKNHYAATLSELDLTICRAVPPGGNWKNIPEHVPSQRLENIRASFSEGKGSRSTYYGRLHPDRPSYTINTYFTRPGNGCHIHYDYAGGQHRTLSQREAARLQSFPDNFEFKGSKTSICTQIGNAVPPLLAFQIARHLGITGQTVDLFAGAGGLGLGFGWAGWETLVGNELESHFADTYRENVHQDIVVGDVRESQITDTLLSKANAARNPALPLCVLGGPPCQGFSTAGNKRSMDDDRNWLFRDYCDLLKALKPDVFVFENVTGLLNMEGGRVFTMVKQELSKHAKRLIVWKLHSENYAIPQRRSRIIIVGDNTGKVSEAPPKMLTAMMGKDLVSNLPPPPSVKDALDDLPSVLPGQDGGSQGYRHKAATAYQEFMRSEISAAQYLERVTR